MAATKRNPMTVPKARDAIAATQLMNRLIDHGFGKVELAPTQVRAIEVVLKKLQPDLQSVAIGQDEKLGPVKVSWES